MGDAETAFDNYRKKMADRIETGERRAAKRAIVAKKDGGRPEVQGLAKRIIKYMTKVGQKGDTEDGAQNALGCSHNHQAFSARWVEILTAGVMERIPALDDAGAQLKDEKGKPVWETKLTTKGRPAVICRIVLGADGKPLTYRSYLPRRNVLLMRGVLAAIAREMFSAARSFQAAYAIEETREAAVQALIESTLKHADQLVENEKLTTKKIKTTQGDPDEIAT